MSEALLVVPRKSWENWRTSRLKSMDSKMTWGICDGVPLRGGTFMADSHQVSVQYRSQNLIGWGNSIRHRCSFTCGFQASRGSTVRGNLLLDQVLMGLKWVVHTLRFEQATNFISCAFWTGSKYAKAHACWILMVDLHLMCYLFFL